MLTFPHQAWEWGHDTNFGLQFSENTFFGTTDHQDDRQL